MKQFSTVTVIRFFLKSKISNILSKRQKRIRASLTKILNLCVSLTISYPIVLLLLRLCLQTHPRQRAFHKVHYYVENSLQIISSCLLNTIVSMDGSISSRSSQTFLVDIWNVVSSSCSVPFCKTEIYEIDEMGLLSFSNQKVIWFNVSMQKGS